METCWTTIGFAGDASCPELPRVRHCHHCRVFIDASRSLFERPHPEGYVETWTRAVSQEKELRATETESLLVFALSGELMAFPTAICEDVLRAFSIHSIPHLTDRTLLGLSSIRGEILPVFSLAAVLGLDAAARPDGTLVAIRERGEVWAFPVDDVLTIHRVAAATVQPPPATLGAAHATFTRGLAMWNDRRVDVLEPALIVRELGRRLG